MNIADLIPEYRSEINNGLADIYPRGPISLTKPVAYVLNGGGKRLRPLLTIFSAEACGGTKSSVFSAALAVEVLHNFTLVHDDIMDQDSIRHGQETVHNKWDDGVAILTGDAMLSLALRLLNETPVESHLQMKIFIDGLLAVCEGQALDKEFETCNTVSLAEYIQMIDLKTGYLIGLSAELGAISVGAKDEDVIKVRNYGRLIGRAFQIQDDLIEAVGDADTIGKSVESDKSKNKAAYPILFGVDESKRRVENLYESACNSLKIFGESPNPLIEMAEIIIRRKL